MKKTKRGTMKKSTAVVLLTLLAVLIVVASVFTFVPFQMGLYDNNSVLGTISLGIDLKGGVYVVLEPVPELKSGATQSEIDAEYERIRESIAGTISQIQSRLANKGYTEATVVEQNQLGQNAALPRIRVEVPDVDDPDEVFNIIGQKAELEFRRDVSVSVGEKADGTKVMTGDHVKTARAGYQENSPVVQLTLTAEGTKIFSDLTTELASSKGSIAICVDGVVISKPTVNEAITSGQAVITGMSDIAQAKNLAVQIQSGALKIKFKNVEPKTISATLGANSLNLSIIAAGIGLLLIFIFMAVVYRGFGLIADIALIVYTLIMLFFLAVLPWVQLSIQGIAGIILSIGMAVDANVIVFSRIKDEYKEGKRFRSAISSGFKKATGAILDGNITTIIAAAVLWIFGNGTIKGFGITLFIGIIISLFTSLVITRLLIYIFAAFNGNGVTDRDIRRQEKFYHLAKTPEEVVE